MEIEFVKISPTQNMTILVTSPVDRQEHKDVAQKIMAYDNVYAEQVGFIEKPGVPRALARLQMAGGEFCGNAALSLCAYLVWKGDVPCKEECTVLVEASGANDVLSCNVKKNDNYFLCKINMPTPECIENLYMKIMGTEYCFPVVYMPGISHVIVDTSRLSAGKDLVVEALISNPDSFTKEDAFGIMFYDKTTCSIDPFVYVKPTGTKVWERSCASGSASLGAYLAYVSGESVKVNVAQPGGMITVEANVTDGEVTDIRIEGKIMIVAEGKAYLQ